jgi:hypothetical protein
MNLKGLTNKIIEGGKLILAQPTIIFTNRQQAQLIKTHTISQREQGRPDLLAMKLYGNTDMIDVLMKFNGISDPFSIKQGDIIQVPNENVAFSRLERPNNISESSVKMQFVDSKRLSQKDKNRKEALKKKYDKESLLPPNTVPVGKRAFKFKKDTIELGQQAQAETTGETDPATLAQNLSPNIDADAIEDAASNIDNLLSGDGPTNAIQPVNNNRGGSGNSNNKISIGSDDNSDDDSDDDGGSTTTDPNDINNC